MRSKILAAGLGLATLFTASQSLALYDRVKDVDVEGSAFAPTPTFHVKNDGHGFTHVQGDTDFSGVVSAECKGLNKVKTVFLGVGSFNVNGFMEASGNPSESHPGNNGKSWSKGLTVEVPPNQAATGAEGVFGDPVQACNVALQSKKDAGQASWHILKNGFELQTSRVLTGAVRCQNNVGNSDDLVYWEKATMSAPAIIQCEGNPSVQGPSAGAPDQIAVPFQITEATFEVDSLTEGYCPTGVDVPVKGRITAMGSGPASFRVLTDGAMGPVSQLVFPKNEHTFEFDMTVEFASDAGGNGVIDEFQTNPSAPGPIDQFQTDTGGLLTKMIAIRTLSPQAKTWPAVPVKVKCGPPKVNPGIVGSTSLKGTQRPNHGAVLPAQGLTIKTPVPTKKTWKRPMKKAGKNRTKMLRPPAQAILVAPPAEPTTAATGRERRPRRR